MMPELGKYAFAVLSAYAGTIVLLVVIIGTSIIRARKVSRALEDAERRHADG